MPDVNEEFARLFFEQCGFLVRTNVKYYVRKGRTGGDSDIDLVVYNTKKEDRDLSDKFILGIDDLKGIEYASIEIKGWHEDRFTSSLIKNSPRIFNFTRDEAQKKATDVLNQRRIKKILIISSLPNNMKKKKDTIQLFKDKGIDHVIEFMVVLTKLWLTIEKNKNYDSEILQTMRLIKKYINPSIPDRNMKK